MQFGVGTGAIVLAIIFLMFLWSAIKILREYDRGVIFFLGRFQSIKGPGLIVIIPGIQKMVKVGLRTIAMDVPPQEVITKDNVSVRVNAVIYFRVVAPDKAIIAVENYLYATSQLAQTTLRSVCGQAELDELLAEREKINKHIQSILDRQTDPWGIKVGIVEIKGIDLPEEMKRAMAKQAEAEREKRAKIIHAAGEMQAAAKILEAANILSQNPLSLQLRYLQTLTEVAAEKNSTTIFPLPIDLIKPFLKGFTGKGEEE
ncbi:MAG: SPFH domain-containing protein [Thermodesulfobacteriota bacterium]|nr:MAG: SPFH domain-containing protein [Thermodesulfobacteriota bacterium]